MPSHEVLVQYLLGKLSEEERSAIAERYFKDDDLFDELLEVETELIDQNIRGSLSEKDQEAFNLYLANLPNRQEKLAAARALIQITGEERERAQQFLDEYVPASVPWRQWLLKSPSRLPSVLQYAVVVGLVVILLGLLLMFFQGRQLRRDNDQLRAELASVEIEKQSAKERARISQAEAAERRRQLEEQLKLEQQVNEAQAQQLASLQPAMAVVVSWILTPALRSAASPDHVTIPRSARFVSITLPIEGAAQASGAQAIIQTTDGQQRREIAGLHANKTGESVSLKLPASYFAATAYKLTLVRKDKDNVELSQDFYFTVTRR